MIRSKSLSRPGFTLMELLVAAALIGVVMGLAMQAFVGLNKISNQARSKLIATDEASKGVREVAALLKRAHVIYYTGKPIQAGQTVDLAGETRAGDRLFPADWTGQNDPPTDPIPPALGGGGTAFVRGPQIPYSFANPTAPILGNLALTNLYRGQYRFWDYQGNGLPPNAGNTLVGGQHLASQEVGAGALPYDKWFPSPLLYIGEATLANDSVAHANDTANNGTIGDMFMPLYWTFHIVYLAPMNCGPDLARGLEPSWNSTQRPMDRGPNFVRSTVPFELRVLTIPGVDADTNLLTASTHRTAITPSGVTEFLNAPWDYPVNGCNYDPVPIPFTPALGANVGAATSLGASTSQRPTVGNVMVTFNSAGARVAGALHVNYNNIGNDPPNETALRRRIAGFGNPRDRVIAQYVDPDSVHGTCVRLLNTIGATPAQTTTQEAQHGTVIAGDVYRRYLNAYGGEFLYNHYRGLLGPAAPWNTQMGAPLPKRALISVATRYRNDNRVPFQFGSDQVEVDLENLLRYQSINRRDR